MKTYSNMTLLEVLKTEKEVNLSGGILQVLQTEMTYHSNRMEGSQITHEQTCDMYCTHSISSDPGKALMVSDVMETNNHFACMRKVIDVAADPLTEQMIKDLHLRLKTGTIDEERGYAVGDYKSIPNYVGNVPTVQPEDVPRLMRRLVEAYGTESKKDLDTILDFHVQFERIHPFQDGNGRVGRLIMFKECLRHNIVPFILTAEQARDYSAGIRGWVQGERWMLRELCVQLQERFKQRLDYFKISY